MKNEFEEALNDMTRQINAALADLLPSGEGEYGVMKRAMRYSAEAGGKRIRPVLTLEFARIGGLSSEQAMPFGCAVECIHTYSLIHDDLPCMDNDALRRGKPSCHIAFGEANALLAGDALLTLAFELIGQAELPDKAKARGCLALARYAGANGMVGGQVMDLQTEGKQIDRDTLWQTVRLKTGALLSAACELGVIAAGGSDAAAAEAARYGELLGLAFQTVDDILDIEGCETALGKPVGSDAENKKVTSVTLQGLSGAKQYAAELTGEALACLTKMPDGGFLEWLTRSLLTRTN